MYDDDMAYTEKGSIYKHKLKVTSSQNENNDTYNMKQCINNLVRKEARFLVK